MTVQTILIVDDEAIIRQTLSADLEEAGYRVTAAESGEAAIALLKKSPVNLVITDLIMEGLDGIQVLKEAKALHPEICVIILTGFGDMTSAIDALRLGADDYLLKPYDFEELTVRIGRCLEKQQLRRKIKLYEEILPICCVCKKIRDDRGKPPNTGEWVQLEKYLTGAAGVKMSHSYCPECARKAMDDIDQGRR